MATRMASLSLMFCCSLAFSAETLREISWDKVSGDGNATHGQLLPPGEQARFHHLKVDNAQAQARTATVLTIDNPGVTSFVYAITGQVRCEGVEGKGHLEMWSHLPGRGPFFTKALADRGPMQCLQGSSKWRRFVLPFNLGKEAIRPNKLVLNVVLPGRGTVYLGPLSLVQYGPQENPLAVLGQWWAEQTTGWIGGILGSVLGCLGGLLTWLASRGKARRFVLATSMAIVLFGIVAIAFGVVALAQSQPWHVPFVLLLLGILCSAVLGSRVRTYRRQYEELEMRKMGAVDAP